VTDAMPRRLAAVVLAAGAASRFGGAKLVARLDGRPILQHVLDAIAEAGLAEVVVVTRPDAEPLEQAIAWRTERRVANPRPEDGLASSLRVGLGAVRLGVEGVIVFPGDQPRVRSIVIRRVVEAWRDGAGPIVAARYSRDGAPNPVLLDRTAWPLAFDLTGDHGMGPILHERPGLVRWIDAAGDNPDIDTRADLERLGGDRSQ
jgi:CTP:molybdopterin cytidylyltransferase MocA